MSGAHISIIIPAFNAGSTIGRAIQSVIGQQEVSIEIIVADGASTDQTIEIVRSFKDRINIFISEPDTGVYQAINRALDHATGEWVYILGADDFLVNNLVMAECLRHSGNHCDLILGDVVNVGSTNSLIPKVHRNSLGPLTCWKNTIHQQGVLYRRSLFQDFRFNEELKVLGDYDMHLMLYKSEVKFVKVEFVIAECSAGGLSKQFKASLYREELQIKRARLSPFIYWVNIPWVWLKFLLKKLG